MAKSESRQALVAEVVEEPLSATLVPLALQDGKVLLGTALRTKRIALIDIKIYALAVYAGPEDFSEGEFVNGNASADDLLATLLTSPAEKVFGLTFLRSVTGKQVEDGLAEGLCNIAKVPREEIEHLTQHLPSSVERGAELQLLVRPLRGDIGFSFGSGMEFLCGKEKLCHGIHEIFFGPESVVRGLGEALQRQRLLLAARGILGNTLPSEHSASDEAARAALPSTSENETISFPVLTPRCQASSEAAENDELEVTTIDGEGSSLGSFSWKQSSGRSRGKEGYKLGDLTRTIIQKTRRNRSNSENILDQDEVWPAAFVAEGERALWVTFGDKDRLDAAAISVQSLKGTFFKYHDSAVRGRLVPQWSVRYYELNAGLLQYRRRAAGKICGADSLDGARIVTEAPKLSRAGAHFVFRIIKGGEAICRLSCPHQQQAVEWVVALAGACTHFRAARIPGEQPRLQVVAQSIDDSKEEEEQRHWDAEEARDTTPVAQPVQDILPAQEEAAKAASGLTRKQEQSATLRTKRPHTGSALSSVEQSSPVWLAFWNSALCSVPTSVRSRLQQLDPYLEPFKVCMRQLADYFQQLGSYLHQFYLWQLKVHLQHLRHHVEKLAPPGQWLRPAIVAFLLIIAGRYSVALR